ncbi:MAG: hypothetical protein ACFFB0_16090 [Promethearchaeota archaeon]
MEPTTPQLLKTIVALSWFHPKIGPSIFYSFPKSQVDKEVADRIFDLMNQPKKEEFLTQSFENLRSLNYYFEIHSDWARGNKEMLMVSTIVDQHLSPEIEEKISNLCKEFSERLQSNKEIFTAFYIKDLNYHENDKDTVIKNEALIKTWLDELYIKIFRKALLSEFLEINRKFEQSMESAINKIESAMEKESVNELTIERQYLPEIFSAELLEISQDDGLPIFKRSVTLYLWYNGILTNVIGNVIKMKKITGDEDENFPFPYIFKPPTLPEDLGIVGEPIAKHPPTEKVPEEEFYCKYCGAELPKGQSICHVCRKKVI